METVNVGRDDFNKILNTAEVLVNEVEQLLSQEEIIKERVEDIHEGRIKGKTEGDYNEYLRKRGIRS